MKPQLVLSALCMGAALFIVSCDKPQSPPPQPQQHQEAKPITVKGFYIGMSAAEVFKAIKDIPGLSPACPSEASSIPTYGFGDYQIVTGSPIVTTENGVSHSIMYFQMEHKIDGKLTGFTWESDVVNYLFHSSSLNAGEFVQQFVNSYNVPEFKYRQTPDGDGQWTYRSPDNILIVINYDKSLTMKRDNSQQDIQRSFN